MDATPHLVQYQGSKRGIAPEILSYFPAAVDTLIEPFAGTCAVSILSAKMNKARRFVLNDINAPLISLMEQCIENPETLADEYHAIWEGQFEEGQDNVSYFNQIRTQFNSGQKEPARFLFLLARVVKGAVRYNAQGQLNQSCDKRRFGTKPNTIRRNASGISNLLKGKVSYYNVDYREILRQAKSGDLVYMDPPYQGTSFQSESRDGRYIQGVDYDEFVAELDKLNQRGIDFIISYDGATGERKIGKDLPEFLELTHLYINAGISAQSVLNGKREITMESLYLSKGLKRDSAAFSKRQEPEFV